jgi:5-amino-6-(5-phospho-D-ribitylamino)uracil phosphatase
MKSFYVSDLDGTLLRDDLSLSAFARGELEALMREGVPLTVASARSIYSIRPRLGSLPFRLPIIEANGAFVTDYATGRKEIVRSIDRERAHAAFGIITAAGCIPFISGHGKGGDFLYFQDLINPGMEFYVQQRKRDKDERLRRTEDIEAVLDTPGAAVTCLSVIDREETVAGLAAEVRSAAGESLIHTLFEFREYPGWHFFTLHDRLATKDHAIRFIRERWNLQDAELVVFGDDVNDEGMFGMADRAVAPSNAKDSIKALAHEIIGTNQEDSVVRYIREHSTERRAG